MEAKNIMQICHKQNGHNRLFFQLDFNYSYHYGNASEIVFLEMYDITTYMYEDLVDLNVAIARLKFALQTIFRSHAACMIFSLCHCWELSNGLIGTSCKDTARGGIRKSVYLMFSYVSVVFWSIMQKLLKQIKFCCNFRIIFDWSKKTFFYSSLMWNRMLSAQRKTLNEKLNAFNIFT